MKTPSLIAAAVAAASLTLAGAAFAQGQPSPPPAAPAVAASTTAQTPVRPEKFEARNRAEHHRGHGGKHHCRRGFKHHRGERKRTQTRAEKPVN